MAGISLSQFRDFELVGQGGGADVYRAVRVSTGGEVAIKAFLATLDPATVARRANREVGALVSLKGHPNIIQIEEVLQVDDAVYVVMEYAPNGSLADRIKAQGRIDPAEIQSIGSQIAAALSAAHSKSILHRDVKPQNILFGLYGAAKLCDFGIAAATLGEQASHTSAISIRYASPEELDGAALTSATDVYSLGATLLHAFAGRPADLNERLAGIDPLVADAPPVLRDVITRCLRLDPTERPTADEVQALLGGPSPAGTVPPTPPLDPAIVAAGLAAPLAEGRAPVEGGRQGVEGSTVGVLFDRPVVDEPVPDPRTPWYRRPLFYAAVALAAIILAVALLLGGGDDDEATTSSTDAPESSTPETTPQTTDATTTVVETTAAPTTVAPETTPAPAVNAFGDVVGQPVDGSSGKPAAFARSLQQRGDAAATTLNLSPAYFYALSFQLTPRVADTSLLPIATEAGYSIVTFTGVIEVRDFELDADGSVVDGTELGAVPPFRISAGTQLTGVCVSGRPQPCDFSGPNGIADLTGSPAQAWVLARVTADVDRVTQMIYVNADGVLAASASIAGEPLGVDPSTGIIAMSVPAATTPGTIVQLDVVLVDGRPMSFSLPAV